MINYQNRRGILISTHIADLHFAAMNPKRQYDILSDQFINKLKDIPRLDLICVNGDLFDHKIGLSSDATMYASLFISEIVLQAGPEIHGNGPNLDLHRHFFPAIQ